MKKTLFALLMSLNGWLFADQNTCEEIDLRRSDIPIRHQGASNYCTAFAVADFVSFYTNHTLSPVDMTLRSIHGRTAMQHGTSNIVSQRNQPHYFSESRLEHRYGGFHLNDTANLAFESGACRADLVRSPGADLVEVLGQIAETKKSYDDSVFWNGFNVFGRESESAISQRIFEQQRQVLQSVFPTLTRTQFQNALRTSQKNTILATLRNSVCRATPYGRPENLTFRGFTHNNQMMSESTVHEILTDVLTSRNILVIMFDANALRPTPPPRDDLAWTSSTRDYIRPPSRGIAPQLILHTLSVFGQRWNASRNRCEVLLKDSAGTDCNYLINVRGLDSGKVTCDAGYLWASKQIVSANTAQILYMRQ